MDFNKDTQYWNGFYKVNPPMCMRQSSFAEFVQKYIHQGDLLIDVGCGNGRDSLYFIKSGIKVFGIDASDVAISELQTYAADGIQFKCGNFINDKELYSQNPDYFYCRFVLHAVDEEGENNFISNTYDALKPGGKLIIEVRSIHDEKYGKGEPMGRNAYILDGHYRRFIVMEELLSKLIKTGYKIKYAEEEEGFAPYASENSPIIRIVATK